jgi:hypothetical protein
MSAMPVVGLGDGVELGAGVGVGLGDGLGPNCACACGATQQTASTIKTEAIKSLARNPPAPALFPPEAQRINPVSKERQPVKTPEIPPAGAICPEFPAPVNACWVQQSGDCHTLCPHCHRGLPTDLTASGNSQAMPEAC